MMLGMHFVIPLLAAILATISAASKSCKDYLTHYTIPIPCCPGRFKQVCCPHIPICEHPHPHPRYTSKQIAQYFMYMKSKANCTERDIDCLPGFVSYPNRTVIPVPPGLHSAVGIRCAIPCDKGAYCPQTHLNISDTTPEKCLKESKCCRNPIGGGTNAHAKNISGVLTCAGSGTNAICPEGYYCPNPSVKTRCVNRPLCPRGSTKPLRCNLSNKCDGDRDWARRWVSIIILLFNLTCIWLIYSAHVHWASVTSFLHSMYTVKRRRDRNTLGVVASALNTVIFHCFHRKTKYMKVIDYTIDIAFSDIEYKVKDHRILSDVFGTFKHGQLSAIMGPSGCGKTTLLNILRGKIRTSGIIKFNGIPVEKVSQFSSAIGYAPQDDIMYSSLTVREVLTFEANIHSTLISSPEDIDRNVSNVLNILGISSIADDIVGDAENRGISGGERRRLNLGMELVKNPTILFCDEPTSGLDSSTSLEMVRTLKWLAEDTGMTIICVIHQPRFEAYALFEQILLLNMNGRVIYNGEGVDAQLYFQSLGFDTNTTRYDSNRVNRVTNPADFVIDVSNGTSVSAICNSVKLPELWMERYVSDFNSICSPPLRSFIKGFDFEYESMTSSRTNLLTGEKREFRPLKSDIPVPHKPSLLQQLYWFYKRELVLQIRGIRILILELFVTIFLSGMMGFMYTTPDMGIEIGKLNLVSMAFGLITVLPSLKYFANDWHVLVRETDAGINRLSYFLAINLFTLPIYLVIFPQSFLSLYYAISYTRATYVEHYVNISVAIFATTGIGQLISTTLNEKRMYLTAVAIVLMSTMIGGSTVTLCEMNSVNVIGPILTSLSYARWYMECQFECEARYYSDSLHKRLYFFAARNTYSLENRSFCLSIMIIIGSVTRFLSYIALVIRT